MQQSQTQPDVKSVTNQKADVTPDILAPEMMVSIPYELNGWSMAQKLAYTNFVKKGMSEFNARLAVGGPVVKTPSDGFKMFIPDLNALEEETERENTHKALKALQAKQAQEAKINAELVIISDSIQNHPTFK